MPQRAARRQYLHFAHSGSLTVARILVIEDNPGNRELMIYLLGAFGHTTLVACNGEEGIEMARRECPNLVLCDIHLPGADGYAVLRELKSDARLQHTPVLAVSAMVMVGDSERGLAAGFDGYIAKPIDPPAFVTLIDRFLKHEQRGIAPTDQQHAGAALLRAPSMHHARVVFVDDSLTNRELIYQTLAPSGYEVFVADTVQLALQLARSVSPDLILSDLHMPDEDGFHFIREVKSEPLLVAVPFIFISSSVWGERDRSQAMQLGVSRFLLRPIEPQKLLMEIADVLSHAAEV
jgi:two-component system cell cycle response regulator